MRTAIIAIAKNEELYIKEWLEYHLKLGFNTIIVCDNDDTPILKRFESDQVTIEECPGDDNHQPKVYTNMFAKYRNDFDWILFIDIDEFLVLEEGDVNSFLSSIPEEARIIRLSCKHFTDNDELDVVDGNYNVHDRFKTPVNTNLNKYVKSFISCKIEKKRPFIYGHSIYDETIYAVNALGEKVISKDVFGDVLYKKAWINHYRTKTIGEYIRQKYRRGGCNKNPNRYFMWEEYFFKTNKKTQEKIDYANKIIKGG